MFYHESVIKKLFSQFNRALRIKSVQSFGGGLYNSVYLVVTEKNDTCGNQFVLRIAPGDEVPKLFYEKDMMRAEPGIHKQVLTETTVPAPRILYTDFSRRKLDVDFLIMELMPGRSGAFSRQELGWYVKQLHTIKGSYYGYPGRELEYKASWRETFFYYVNNIFADCLSAGAITDRECRRFLDVFHSHEYAVGERDPLLLHLDLWGANILAEHGKITGILDFDRGMFGDPELEFAVLDTYGYSTPDFFRGYGADRPGDTDAVIRQKLYLVYELIKYAFIRLARGGSRGAARQHVAECQAIMRGLG